MASLVEPLTLEASVIKLETPKAQQLLTMNLLDQPGTIVKPAIRLDNLIDPPALH